MKTFLFNDCGVCTNSDLYEVKKPGYSIHIKTAEVNGIWGYGVDVTYNNKDHGNGGFCWGVNLVSLKYTQKEDAVNAGIEDVFRRLSIIQVNDIQLQLF